MYYYKIGTNFSNEFLNYAIKVNNAFNDSCIEEMYGAIREHSQWSARPAFRLPEVDKGELELYVDKLRKNNIDLNYTLNTNYFGNRHDIFLNEKKLKKEVQYLNSIGVFKFTVTLPLVAEFIKEVNEKNLIEVSTIAHIDTVSQLEIWNEEIGIYRVCVNLMHNRNINFLKNISKLAEKRKFDIELMVNEFCGSTTKSEKKICATHCIYRDFCYQLHSIGYSYEEYIGTSMYPMNRCMAGRNGDVEWIKMNYIRPEDIRKYREIGINHFKITGRTGTSQYLKGVINAYLEQKYEGNLLELWHHLEKITNDKYNPEKYIENKKLDGFIDFWFDNPTHRCSDEVCAETCSYCDEFYKKYIK